MLGDYNSVTSRTAEEFKGLAPAASDLEDATKFTKSDEEDIRAIERLLDVQEGTLAGDSYYLERAQCRCGRLLTMRDFVFTGLIDAGHSKSFILHTLVGTKYIINRPRPVRCMECGATSEERHSYSMAKYSCTATPETQEAVHQHQRSSFLATDFSSVSGPRSGVH